VRGADSVLTITIITIDVLNYFLILIKYHQTKMLDYKRIFYRPKLTIKWSAFID